MQTEDKKKVYDLLLFNAAFLLIIWGMYYFDREFSWGLWRYGNHPREADGLIGVFSMPFLHGSYEHLRGNSMSFFVLSSFLIFFYREIAFRVLMWLYVGSGVLLWLWGGGGNHIGASGVIYGIASFIFVSGVVRRNPVLMRVSLAVAFLYGSMVWWVLPIEKHISWEGHLAGAVMGLILALAYKNLGPQRKVYDWENEPDDFDVEFIEVTPHGEIVHGPSAEPSSSESHESAKPSEKGATGGWTSSSTWQ